MLEVYLTGTSRWCKRLPLQLVFIVLLTAIRNHRATVAGLWQLYKNTDYRIDEYVVIIDMTFYSRIQACVMANQRAMKLREGTVYKVKFYVFFSKNLVLQANYAWYEILVFWGKDEQCSLNILCANSGWFTLSCLFKYFLNCMSNIRHNPNKCIGWFLWWLGNILFYNHKIHNINMDRNGQ